MTFFTTEGTEIAEKMKPLKFQIPNKLQKSKFEIAKML
jgi:hypothetical protein